MGIQLLESTGDDLWKVCTVLALCTLLLKSSTAAQHNDILVARPFRVLLDLQNEDY